MSIRNCRILLLLAFLVIPVFISNAQDTTGLFVPDQKIDAQVMALRMNEEVQRLAAKMQIAIGDKYEWFQEHLKKHGDKGVLPYHENFGISEVEYDYFVENAQRSFTLEVDYEIELEFEKLADRKYRINTDKPNFPLNDITVDLRLDRVMTPYGVLEDRSEVNNEDQASPTGPWSGLQWAYEDAKELQDLHNLDATVVKLALGRQKGNGNYIIYYDVKAFSKARQEKYRIIIYYRP